MNERSDSAWEFPMVLPQRPEDRPKLVSGSRRGARCHGCGVQIDPHAAQYARNMQTLTFWCADCRRRARENDGIGGMVVAS